jgi:Rrf2 family transcriptional regulator, iron-sulfur cluster assembly transcription factor
MMFSKACEYGIRATLYIASESLVGRRPSLKQIANESDSPVAFIAKILQTLVKKQVIQSLKGPTGGFEIKKEHLNSLSLSDVVKAIDGDAIFTGCGLGLKLCDSVNPCPVHNRFKQVRDDLKHLLESSSIKEMAMRLNNGESTITNRIENLNSNEHAKA